MTVSLCGSAALPATFDTRLFVLQDVDSGGSLNLLACDDNSCGGSSQLSTLTASAVPGNGQGATLASTAAQALCNTLGVRLSGTNIGTTRAPMEQA